MAWILLNHYFVDPKNPKNTGDTLDQGSLLQGLVFEAGGEASKSPQMTVLSCGGIFVPRRRKLNVELKKWRQIVNLPGPELSAKIFGYEIIPDEAVSPRGLPVELESVLRKEVLN